MNTPKKLKTHKLLAILAITFGILLLSYMIVIEGEPGAVPLLLITAGTGWYFYARSRSRTKSHRQD